MIDLMTVTIACPSEDVAEALAQGLVDTRLAACVQTHPVRSTYVWQGEVEVAGEHLLMAKTLRGKLEALEAYVVKHHPYDVPEIIAHRVEWVSDAYAQWVGETLA